jgi:hypothetical protein
MKKAMFLTICALLMLAPAAQATSIIYNPSDSNIVTGIEDLVVESVEYDVFFERGTFAAVFDFSGDIGSWVAPQIWGRADLAIAAADAINSLFNSTNGGDVEILSIAFNPFYFVPHSFSGSSVLNALGYDSSGNWMTDPDTDWSASVESGSYLYAKFSSSTPVPEPATMLLLGTGLVGLAGVGRRKLKRKK